MIAPPRYEHPPRKVREDQVRRWSIADVVDSAFFAVATVATFVLAWTLLRQGLLSLTHALYFIVVWIVSAYLGLPRLHRILTIIYVPDYFMGRTRTSDGLLGDPVNLAFEGSEAQIHTAMRQAGWTLADPINLSSSLRMVRAWLLRRSYPAAPVSSLFLFGRAQDFAYQQEVAGNVAQRHHLRFWRVPSGWLLPGGHRVGWLAAGTYDRSVGFSLFTLQITHKIDENIDIERDYIVDAIRYHVPQAAVRTISNFSSGYHHRNGGGDSVRTDGDLPVIELDRVPPLASAHVESVSRSMSARESLDKRPLTLVVGLLLLLTSLVAQALYAALRAAQMLQHPTLAEPQVAGVSVSWFLVLLGVISALIVGLAWLTYEGSPHARVLLLSLMCVALFIQTPALFADDPESVRTVGLLQAAANVLAVYSLSSRSTRQWLAGRSQARKALRAAA